jgi:predicted kinase
MAGMKHLLILMIGHPGSGKTYFTRQLAEKIHAVRFNGDHMRRAMFGEDLSNITRAENPKVFGAVDYAAQQVLKAGHSVIYDAQCNKRADREKGRGWAKEYDAQVVLVWVKTPYEVALKRGTEREELDDQRRKTEEQMRASIDFFIEALEVPGEDEPYIVIDGTAPFEEQYEVFMRELQKLVA